MTAAELLRDLASVNEMFAEEREALRVLLPELAALVEAVGEYIEADGDRTFSAMVDAMDAINAKAAELGGK